MDYMIFALFLSVVSFAISLIALLWNLYLMKIRKTENEIEDDGSEFADRIQFYGEDLDGVHLLRLVVQGKNNIRKTYLIHSDCIVEEIRTDEIEEKLETKINAKMEMGVPDLVCGDVLYNYKFLLLQEWNCIYELYLIYTKSTHGIFSEQILSGAEVWRLKNKYRDSPEYVGEKVMAEQYSRLRQEISDYVL